MSGSADRRPPDARVTRAAIALPPGHALVAGPEITRDGQRVAFVSTDGAAPPQIYTRRLDEAELRVLGRDRTGELFVLLT